MTENKKTNLGLLALATALTALGSHHLDNKRQEKDLERNVYSAARQGDIPKIKDFILNKKIDVNMNITTEFNSTPLIIAAKNGQEYIASFLLKKGADINARDKHGDTALMLASRKGYTEIVEILRAAMVGEIPVLPASDPAPEEDKAASLITRSYTIEGVTCKIRGNTTNVSVRKDISTIPLPQGCALMPR